jgi:hypothetical protein
MSALEVTFFAPGRLLSANDRSHYRVRARDVREWRTAAYFAAVAAFPGQGPEARSVGPRVVELELPVAGSRRRDPHNYAPTLKAVVDGLVDAGLWPDDTPEHVRTLEPKLVQASGTSYRTVLVRLHPFEVPT